MRRRNIRQIIVFIISLLFFTLIILWGMIRNIEGYPQAYDEMKKQAETAIKKAGGFNILEHEAKVYLTRMRSDVDAEYKNIISEGRDYPAITKLHDLLSARSPGLWGVINQKKIPDHVVIRFGSHARYAYVWIFDSAHMPEVTQSERVEHLGGSVFISERNE